MRYCPIERAIDWLKPLLCKPYIIYAMKKILYLFITLFVISEGFSQRKIDLYGNLNNTKTTPLSMVAKNIKYIPLETKNECLMSAELQIYYEGSFIFVGDQKTQSFYRFDSEGKFLNKIGNKGNAPSEYPDALFFQIDNTERKIYVVSSQSRCLYKYEYNGTFIEKIPMEATSWTIDFFNNNIVYYNFQYNRIKRKKDVFELFQTDKNGKELNKIPTTVKDEKDDVLLFDLPFFYSYNNQLFYKNAVQPYVYRIDNVFKINPVYEIVTGGLKNKHEPEDYKNLKKYADKIGVRNIFENQHYLLITYVYKDKFRYLLGNKANWTFNNVVDNTNESGFIDDLKNGPRFMPVNHIGSKLNCLIAIVSAEDMSEYDIIKNLNTDDNPIIAVAFIK